MSCNDQVAFGFRFLLAAEKKLPEAAAMFDLAERWFGDCLAANVFGSPFSLFEVCGPSFPSRSDPLECGLSERERLVRYASTDRPSEARIPDTIAGLPQTNAKTPQDAGDEFDHRAKVRNVVPHDDSEGHVRFASRHDLPR